MTKTYWLSFCDGERPTGQQFLGVAIVDVTDADVDAIREELRAKFPKAKDGAEWLAAASRKAWALGCNPGGEMLSHEMPAEALELPQMLATPRGVLLDKPTLAALGHL